MVIDINFIPRKSFARPIYMHLFLAACAVWLVAYEVSFYHPQRITYFWTSLNKPFFIQSVNELMTHANVVSAALIALFLVVLLIASSLRFELSVITYLAVIGTIIWLGPQSLKAERTYKEYLSSQKSLPRLDNQSPGTSKPIKIVILHLCSISIDDLEITYLKNHPFWDQFDFVSWNFNSATCYSNIAVLYLMKSMRGHINALQLNWLYDETDHSILTNYLRDNNFTITSLFDHDGTGYSFATQALQRANVPLPKIIEGGDSLGFNTDGSKLYSHQKLFSTAKEILSAPGRQLIYSNIIFLHQGIQLTNNVVAKNSYGLRFTYLTNKISTFLKDLETSRMPVLVILVGEHGFPLNKKWPQISKLRDIPTRKVTIVPFAVKITGGSQVKKLRSSDLMSNYDISRLIAHYVQGQVTKQELINELNSPSPTHFVSESTQWIVVESEGKDYIRNQKGRVWWHLN